MSLSSRVVSGLKASFLAETVSVGANAVLVVVLARLLGPNGYGRLNFALSVLVVVSIFGSMGVPKSSARYIAEYGETDPTHVPYILRITLVYVLVLTGVVGTALAVFSTPLARMLGDKSLAPLLVVGVLYVGGRSLNAYLSSAFQGLNRVTWLAVVQMVSDVGRLVFAVGFVVSGLGAFGALSGYVVGYALSVVVGFFVLYTRFYTTFGEATEPDPHLARRILEYSLPITATQGASVLDNRIDTILVGTLLDTTAVGYYTLAKQVVSFAAAPAQSISTAVSPALGTMKAKNQLDRAVALYEQSLKYILLLYVAAGVGLVVVAGPLVQYVFGPEYLPAVPVVRVISGYAVAHAINSVTSNGLDFLGRARERAIAQGIAAGSNFVLNLLFIPTLGVVGAAVATVVTYSLYTVVNLYYMHEEFPFRVGWLLSTAVVVVAIALGMGGVVFVSQQYISGVTSLVAAILLGVVVWAVLAVGSGVLNIRRVRSFLF